MLPKVKSSESCHFGLGANEKSKGLGRRWGRQHTAGLNSLGHQRLSWLAHFFQSCSFALQNNLLPYYRILYIVGIGLVKGGFVDHGLVKCHITPSLCTVMATLAC